MQIGFQRSLLQASMAAAPFDNSESIQSFLLCYRNDLGNLVEIVKMDIFHLKF